MDIQAKIALIKNERSENGNKRFIVEYSDGRAKEMRLFVTSDDRICEFKKGSSRYGWGLNTQDIVDIRAVATKPAWEIAERNRKRAIGYLTKSKLNPQLLAELENAGEITEANMPNGSLWECLYSTRSIKTIDYTTTWRKDELQEKITALTPFQECWRGRSYDISLSLDEKGRAFYAEEYRNCGNGHYYLALDARHAIHVEDD